MSVWPTSDRRFRTRSPRLLFRSTNTGPLGPYRRTRYFRRPNGVLRKYTSNAGVSV